MVGLGVCACYFSKVVEKFGFNVDPDTAVLAAKRYTEKCARMGGTWCEYDPMTEMMTFLLVEKTFRQEFQEAWELYEHEYSEGASTRAEASSPSVQQYKLTLFPKLNVST